nr:chloride channel protein [Aureimonas ureilytica]
MLVPGAGSLIIGLMARFGSDKIRGHGIPEAIEAILFGQSRMSPKVAVLKPLSSAVSIGSGGPFGAEGPIILTGGAIGSLFAQCFHLSGAAAGMTAIFGTPVAAMLLAVEVLLFEWKPRSFVPVSVAALTAIAWRPAWIGAGPMFVLTAPLAGDAAMLAGVAAAFFAKVAHRAYPVVDGEGRVLGLVSRTDALRWSQTPPEADTTICELVADHSLHRVSPLLPVDRAAELMLAEEIGRLLVVDDEGRLIGLLARRDLLRARADYRRDERDRSRFAGMA